MCPQRPSNRLFWVTLAAVALLTAGAVACNGDDSSGDPPSPAGSPGATTVTTTPTPGTGVQPINAILSYLQANSLDGHELDLDTETDCSRDTLATPGVTSTVNLGQFCLTSKDVVPQESLTTIIQLPDTGETWEVKLEFDADVSLWMIKDIDKIGQ
jgi:hypothetical protein